MTDKSINMRRVVQFLRLRDSLTPQEQATVEFIGGLSDAEVQVLMDWLRPQPQKKSSKKSAGGGGRSKRGAALGDKIRDNLQQRQPTSGGFADDVDMVRCQFTRADGNLCKLLPDHNIHHMTTANEYHEFQSASSTTGKSDAQSAAGGS